MKKFIAGLLAWLILAGYGAVPVGAYSEATASKFYSTTGTGDIKVGDIKLMGNDLVDPNGTTRFTIGATNTITGNLSVTGNISVSGGSTFTGGFSAIVSTAPRTAAAVASIYTSFSPSTGTIFYDSTAGVMCVSSGTVQTSITVSTGTGACPH